MQNKHPTVIRITSEYNFDRNRKSDRTRQEHEFSFLDAMHLKIKIHKGKKGLMASSFSNAIKNAIVI